MLDFPNGGGYFDGMSPIALDVAAGIILAAFPMYLAAVAMRHSRMGRPAASFGCGLAAGALVFFLVAGVFDMSLWWH
jgi:hypothetical protein